MKNVRLPAALCCLLVFNFYCAAQGRTEKHPGLHPVRDSSGKWGFIDRTGRFRIMPKYQGAGEFSDGVAYVWMWEGEKRINGIVDPNGKFTPLETNGYEVSFHDGLARFQTPSGERKYGYINKSGRVIIEPQFFDSGHFSEGLTWVAVLKERKWLYGFIDKTGKMVIEPQFVYQPRDFVEGFAKVMGQLESGFVDQTGRIRIKTEFEQADDFFSESLLAIVIPGDSPRGVYLDRESKVVLEIPFWQQRTVRQRSQYSLRRLQLAPFSEGLAAVLSFNKLGFIDKKGRVVVDPEFRETKGFSEGLAAVKIIGSDGQYVWGFIDRTGKLVIEPKFRSTQSFRGGLARVTTFEDKEELIDRNGRVVWRVGR